MKTSAPTLLLGFTSVALLASTLRAAPLPADGASYQLTDLGALPAHKESPAAAINNSGQIAGTSRAELSPRLPFAMNLRPALCAKSERSPAAPARVPSV